MTTPAASHRSPRRRNVVIAGLAVAGIAVGATLAGMALAKSFVLQVAPAAKIVAAGGQTTRANIVVTPQGRAVYTLSGDSRHHPECTLANSCLQFWPPVRVGAAKKLTAAHGVKGRLGVWRHDGLAQLTLGGHPLYRYSADTRRALATGEGIHGFHGTWRVVFASPRQSGGAPTTTSSTSTSSTTTNSPYGY